jgi:hypothetical protein
MVRPDRHSVVDCIQAFQSLDCGDVENVLKREEWVQALSDGGDAQLEEAGYVEVSVYAPPKHPRTGLSHAYLFARDEDGREYYVPRRATSLSQDDFSHIGVGSRLYVLPNLDVVDDQKAAGVRDAILL